MTINPPKSKASNQDLVFEVAEFAHYDKGLIWYGCALLVFAVIIFGSIYTNNLRLGIILLFATAVFYQLALANPQKVKLVISKKGIQFKDKFYPWEIFHSFSVHGDSKHSIMKLEKLDMLKNPLIISLPLTRTLIDKNDKNLTDKDVATIAIRSVLPEKLQADQPFGDWVTRLFRF